MMIGIGVIPFQTRIASKGMDAIFYNTSPLVKIPGISKKHEYTAYAHSTKSQIGNQYRITKRYV